MAAAGAGMIDLKSLIGGGINLASSGAATMKEMYGYDWKPEEFIQLAGGQMDAGDRSGKVTTLTNVTSKPRRRERNKQYGLLNTLEMIPNIIGTVWNNSNVNLNKQLDSPVTTNVLAPTTPREATFEDSVPATPATTPEPTMETWVQDLLMWQTNENIKPTTPGEATFEDPVMGAASGAKAPARTGVKVVNWRRINKGIVGVDSTKEEVGGLPVLAAKGEIKVDLEDQQGNTSDAILNMDQWHQFLGGTDINDILATIPEVTRQRTAQDGVKSGSFAADLITSKKSSTDKMMDELEKNLELTKSLNLGRAAASGLGSLGGILYNASLNYDHTPVTAPVIKAQRVNFVTPTMDTEKRDLDAAFTTSIRAAIETGKPEMIMGLYNNYVTGRDKFAATKFNLTADTKNKEQMANAEFANQADTRNTMAKLEADRQNQQTEMWLSQLKDANVQKSFKMGMDILDVGTQAAKYNADADLQAILAKHKVQSSNEQFVLDLLKSIQ